MHDAISAVAAGPDESIFFVPGTPPCSNTGGSTIQPPPGGPTGQVPTSPTLPKFQPRAFIDTAYISAWVDWRSAIWKALKARLEAAQANGEHNQGQPGCREWVSGERPDGSQGRKLYLGLKPYRYSPKVKFEWVGEMLGCQVAIADQATGLPQMPNVRLQVPGEAIMRAGGFVPLLDAFRELIAELGGTIGREEFQRLDLACDTPGQVATFHDAWRAGARVCRATRFHPIYDGDTCETFYVGSRGSPIVARVYDKLRELLAKGGPEKLREYLDFLGLEAPPPAVRRVEFELSGDFFKEVTGDDRDVGKVLARLPLIARYLTETWLRFTADPVQRNHTARALNLAEWDQVAETMRQDLGNGGKLVRVIKPRNGQTRLMVAQQAAAGFRKLWLFAERTIPEFMRGTEVELPGGPAWSAHNSLFLALGKMTAAAPASIPAVELMHTFTQVLAILGRHIHGKIVCEARKRGYLEPIRTRPFSWDQFTPERQQLLTFFLPPRHAARF